MKLFADAFLAPGECFSNGSDFCGCQLVRTPDTAALAAEVQALGNGMEFVERDSELAGNAQARYVVAKHGNDLLFGLFRERLPVRDALAQSQQPLRFRNRR